MSQLTEALLEFDSWIENSKSWHANRIRSYKTVTGLEIRPGLEREIIELSSEEYSFQLSEEVYELYQWHDGIIEMGDMANPVFFVNLDCAISYVCKFEFPCLPIFIGDDTFYVIHAAEPGQKFSPIYHYNGRIGSGTFVHGAYSPSITSLIQAVAECAKTHDGISASLKSMDGSKEDIYRYHPKYHSILSPIYEKYGVVGDCSGLWQ
jgi:hypothetical protein